MKIKNLLSVLPCLAFITACSSNISRTHRGDLLDDKVTAQRVQAELGRAGNDFKNVHADATNGVVVLSGSVRSPEVRSRAEQIASSVRRAGKVEDNVQVQK